MDHPFNFLSFPSRSFPTSLSSEWKSNESHLNNLISNCFLFILRAVPLFSPVCLSFKWFGNNSNPKKNIKKWSQKNWRSLHQTGHDTIHFSWLPRGKWAVQFCFYQISGSVNRLGIMVITSIKGLSFPELLNLLCRALDQCTISRQFRPSWSIENFWNNDMLFSTLMHQSIA